MKITALDAAMPRSKSPLWLSGALLIFTYTIFGWLSASWQVPSRWVILVTITLFADILATYFDQAMNIFLQGMFGANVRSLFCVMGLATLTVIMMTKLPIFIYASLILAVALLFSIDSYEVGMNHLANFMLLVICQIFSLGLGFGSNIFWWRAVHYWQSLHP
jgi:hypothetical protein